MKTDGRLRRFEGSGGYYEKRNKNSIKEFFDSIQYCVCFIFNCLFHRNISPTVSSDRCRMDSKTSGGREIAVALVIDSLTIFPLYFIIKTK